MPDMPEHRPSAISRLLHFRALFAVNLGVLALLGAAFGREWMRNRDIRDQIADLQGKAAALEARNVRIGELATMLQTESAIEREARLKLGLKKPGESVVVVRRDEGTASAADRGASEPVDPRGVANSSKWWAYFFDQPRYRTLVQK
ncbi:septum formation initiator family protein [Patescibacteria group bacterium]|nr:MAG: septum formation initiator family protein [Patescibacteria group bacterium]